MGGPSSRADDAHQRQLAVSNSTLNMFLGGRQPAWLTAATVDAAPSTLPAPTVNPRSSRVYSRTTAPPQTALLPLTSPTTVTPNDIRVSRNRHDSSTSISPRLANMPPPRQTALNSPATPVLPSPSPSDDSILDSNQLVTVEGAVVDQRMYLPSNDVFVPAGHSRKRSITSNNTDSLKRARMEDNRQQQQQHNILRMQQPRGLYDSNRRHSGVQSDSHQNQIGSQSTNGSQPAFPVPSSTPVESSQFQQPSTPKDFSMSRDVLNPVTATPSLEQADPNSLRPSINQDQPMMSPNIAHTLPPQALGQSQSRRPSKLFSSNVSSQKPSRVQQPIQHTATVPQQLDRQYREHQEASQLPYQEHQYQDLRQQQLREPQLQQQRYREQQHQQQFQHEQLQQQTQPHAPVSHNTLSGSVRRNQNQTTQSMAAPRSQAPISNLPYHVSVCAPILQTFASEHRPESLSMIARSRLEVFHNAIQSNDAAFLFIHQILCLHSIDPNAVPSSLRLLPTFEAAMGALDQILALNSHLDPQLVRWFAVFPMPLADVAIRFDQTYALGIQVTKQLVARFGFHWNRFHDDCRKRSCPPVASQLLGHLGVESPLLMDILFTAVLRSIWGNHEERNPIYEQVRTIFRRNREWFTTRNAQGPIPEGERAHFDNQCIGQYIQLYNQFRKSRMSNAHPRQVPALTVNRASENHGTPLNAAVALSQTQTRMGINPREPLATFPAQNGALSTRLAAQGVLPNRNNTPAQVRAVQRRHPDIPIPPVSLPAVRFLPSAEARAPPLPANPTWQHSALHQAHLRSPVLRQDDPLGQDRKPVLYQVIKGFALKPKRLDLGSLVHERKFMVSSEMMAQIPPTIPSSIPGGPPTRHLTERSLQFRLRCSKWTRTEAAIEEEDWVVSDTYWPSYIYLTFNSTILEIRRKLHFGKDLPIDLTEHVVEGENTLQICLNIDLANPEYGQYAFAVETIGVKGQEGIVQECNVRLQPTNEVLSSIKSSLLDDSADDDDIVMVSQNVTINLYDPISLKQMCDTPVRSKHCVHRHCFDLGTFLQGRTRAKPDQPSMIDVWRCPICRGDARPQTLVVDGFLVDVGKELARKKDEETRAIIVHQDGSWTCRPEKKSGQGSNKNTPSRNASVSFGIGRSTAASPVQTSLPSPSGFTTSPLQSALRDISEAQALPRTAQPPTIIDMDDDSD
jgi:hypothetical protein